MIWCDVGFCPNLVRDDWNAPDASVHVTIFLMTLSTVDVVTNMERKFASALEKTQQLLNLRFGSVSSFFNDFFLSEHKIMSEHNSLAPL